MMREKTTNPKRVRGTVLFTVVAVMMVLTVFLAATLALATTANRRAYTNYQQEQSEYTARAVLEAVTQQVQTDAAADGSGICSQICGVDPNTSTSIPVTIDDGTTIQTHEVIVTNTDSTQSMYDATLGTFRDYPVYQLSVTVNSDTTNASATYETYLALEVVTDPGTPPTPPVYPPSAGDGGAFVSLGDTEGNELSTKGYTTGGTYLGIVPEDPTVPYHFTMSSNGANVIDAPFYVNGSLTSPSRFWMHFTKPDDFMVIKGDLNIINNDSLWTSFDGYSDAGENYENTPYIYVEGKFTSAVGTKIGDANHAVNLYCGSINFGGTNGDPEIYGDVYLMDAGQESVFGNGGSTTHLYQWTKTTLSRTDAYGSVDTNYGSIFSMGSVKFQGGRTQDVKGNVQIKENMTVENLTVEGDVYVNGKLTVTGNLTVNGNIWVGELDNRGNINCAGTINVANLAGANQGNLNGKTAAEIAGLTPTATDTSYSVYYTEYGQDSGVPQIDVHTKADRNWWPDNQYSVDARYREHRIYADGTTEEVDFGQAWGGLDPLIPESTYDLAANPTGIEDYLLNNNETYKALRTANDASSAMPITNTTYSYDLDSVIGREIYPADYTKADLDANKLEHPEAVDYNTLYPTSINSLDSSLFSGGQYQVPIYGYGSTKYGSAVGAGDLSTLDAGGYYKITTDCVLTGSFNQNIYIDGTSGTRTVIMDNVYLEGNNGTSIIVNDASNVTIFVVNRLELGTSGQGTAMITTDYLDMMLGAGGWSLTDNFKNITSRMVNDITVQQEQMVGSPAYPSIIVHSDENSTMKVHNGGLVTALIRAPKMNYESDQAYTASRTLNYVLPTGETVKYGAGCDISGDDNAIGLIGQLIAGKIILPSNGSWGMLYVTDPSSGSTPPGSTPPTTPITPGTPGTPGGATHATLGVLYSNVY